MRRRTKDALTLGSGVVELLIPHRRPFLMVDGIDAFGRSDPPRLNAYRSISVNEPVFGGHFPDLPLWPGALTMEGLGQAGVLLLTLTSICDLVEAEGGDATEAMAALENLDRGFRLHPGYRPAELPRFLEPGARRPALAVGAAVDLKFVAPVFPGCRLDYAVELADHLGDRVRFSAQASVDGTTVAKGMITGALLQAARPPIRP